ncbi:Uncharacterized protein APZ42_025102 [Daphnia magna]|uniref:Nuclease HARBI1 n=1 Tax=Daphnia magna TaxID=35525 RepID=A0A164TH34_9CRUS|nr:Uncharacterized protein APZ42_025102 [Daphnia magna]
MDSVIVFVYTMADHTDVIDEFLEDLDNLTDNVDDFSTESAMLIQNEPMNALMRTFRFDRPSIEYLTALVTDILPKRETAAKRSLLPLDMVLIALQFYATGTSQNVIRNVLRYSQSSVSRSISAVSLALCLISLNHIRFPDNLNDLKRDFAEIARIPGIIGSIDGTHIRIQRPILHEKAYVM